MYWYLMGFQSALLIASMAFNVWILNLGRESKQEKEFRLDDSYYA